MDNTISMLSLVENQSPFVSHAQQQITEAVLKFFPNANRFTEYKNTRELLCGLSEAFSQSEVVILGAESSLYLSLKRLLVKVLKLEDENNADILAAIAESGEDVAENVVAAHSLIPKGACLFISEDGFYSGFALKSGKQHLIVLPLDTSRIDIVIQNGFLKYLSKITGCAENTAAIAHKNNDVIIETVNALIAAGLDVALASAKTASFIKNMIHTVPGAENVLQFVDCDREKGSLTQKEYTAALARQARENRSSILGAAISNVFYSEKNGGQLFIFVALSDNNRSRVAKVFSEPGETPRMLVDAAIETLFTMFMDYAEIGGFTGYPNEEEKPLPQQEKKNKKRIIFWLLLCGIVAILLSLEYIYFIGKGSKKIPDLSTTAGTSISASNTVADKTASMQSYTE